MRLGGRAMAGVVVAAGLLRAARLPARWDEVALAYAAYTEPVARALAQRELGVAVGTWVGLHPPLYAWLLTGLEALSPRPALALALSAGLSLAAVALVGRVGGALAAAVIASAPLQLAYCAELNNYPLAVAAVAALLAAAEAPWPWLAVAAVLAGWSHLLGGAAAGAVVLWRLPRLAWAERARLLGVVALGWAPLGAGVLRRLSLSSTWAQGGDALAWLRGALGAVGLEGLALGALALFGLRGAERVAALAVAAALGASLISGAAAPHQLPYLLLLGPPAALGVARVARHPWAQGAVLALCLVRAGRLGLAEGSALAALKADQGIPRAIDAAVAASRPGDALWLVSPALEPDDDKGATSAVLWRLPPWEPMPRLRTLPYEYTDPRFGQPRIWRGRWVFTSTDLDPGALDAVAGAVLQGAARLWIVLYDAGPAPGLSAGMARALRPYRFEETEEGPAGPLGQDRLYRVDGRAW